MSIVNYDKARTWQWLYRRNLDDEELQQSGHPLFGQRITMGRDYAYMMQGPFDTGLLNWHRNYWQAITADYRWDAGFGRAQSFITIPTDAHVLFVGSGFGYLAEAARSLGWTSLACFDISNWIQDHKADLGYRWDGGAWVQDTANAVENIMVNDISNPAQSKNALKSVFNNGTGEPDFVITESVLSGLTDPTDPLYDTGEGDADDLTPFFEDCDAMLAPGGTVIHMSDLTIKAPFNVKTLAEWKALYPTHRFAASGYFVQDWEIL